MKRLNRLALLAALTTVGIGLVSCGDDEKVAPSPIETPDNPSNPDNPDNPDTPSNGKVKVRCADCSGRGTCPTCQGTGQGCQQCNGTGQWCGACKGNGRCDLCRGSGQCFICNGSGTGNCYSCSGGGRCGVCHGVGKIYYGTTSVTCTRCGGTGTCSTCYGTGKRKCTTCYGTGRCEACNGKGICTVCHGNPVCSKCGGDGHCADCNRSGKCATCQGAGYTWEDPTDASDAFCPDSRHPHMIDMGGNIKWACCNVGAKKPVEYGNYYAWGETQTKQSYTWDTYKWNAPDDMTKYNKQDLLTKLEPTDDAATALWGSQWRMPKYDEYSALIENCTWEHLYLAGTEGIKVTAPNGNRIYLPCTGWAANDNDPYNTVYAFGVYWASERLSDQFYGYACFFQCDFTDQTVEKNTQGRIRSLGLAIRAVSDK